MRLARSFQASQPATVAKSANGIEAIRMTLREMLCASGSPFSCRLEPHIEQP